MSVANYVTSITRELPTVNTIQLQNTNQTNRSVVQPRGGMPVVQPREDRTTLQPGEDMPYDSPPPYIPSKIAMR